MKTIYKSLIALILLGITQFSYSQNTYATASGLGTLTCAGSPYNNIAAGNTTGAGSECGNGAEDQWYSFTITAAADVTIDLCGSGYDTYLRLYNSGAASCAAATQVAFNDDGCGLQSSITQNGLAAGTYIVMVEGFSSNAGTYTMNITVSNCATPMAYSSIAVTQASTANSYQGAAAQEVLRIEVVTTGSTSPIDLTQLRIRINNVTLISDVTAVNIYSTGNSATFSTGTLFGTMAVNTNWTNVNGSQTLVSGSNYFWVTLDVSATAIVGNFIDAKCRKAVVDGVDRLSDIVQNPIGNREIIALPGSPGGVNTNILFWLKANAGLTTTGSNVTAWSDQSSASTTITVNGSPDEVVVGRNYNPIIDWTKSNGVDGGDFLSTADVNVQSIFTVAQLTDITRNATHIVTYNDVTTSQPCAQCALHGGNSPGGNAAYAGTGYGNGNFQSAGVWRTNGDPTGTTNLTEHSGNFDIVTALGNGTGSANSFLGGQTTTGWFDGRSRDWFGPVAEMIVYSGPITTTEANKIESYLAIKYGITLGGNGSTTLAYTSSTGSSLWTANSGYHNDVIGIGRDDTQELQQKQSQTTDDSTRIYLNTLQASNVANTGTFTTDVSYILLGNNKGILRNSVSANAEVPASCGLYSRLEREWKVTKTNITDDFSIDIKLNSSAAPGSVNIADLRFLVDDDGDFSNGGTSCYFNGDASGTVISYSNPVITVSGISNTHIANNANRYITIGSTNGATPLPVELIKFDATCQSNKVAINWATESEINNDYFTIERSKDDNEFELLKTINGNGNSASLINYSWTDDNPINGTAYYRLKQTDFNGAFEYHGVIAVSCEQSYPISFYPNPFENSFTVQLSENTTHPITAEVLNYLGKKIHTQTIKTSSTEITLDDQLPTGTYFVKVITETTQKVKRIIKMK